MNNGHRREKNRIKSYKNKVSNNRKYDGKSSKKTNILTSDEIKGKFRKILGRGKNNVDTFDLKGTTYIAVRESEEVKDTVNSQLEDNKITPQKIESSEYSKKVKKFKDSLDVKKLIQQSMRKSEVEYEKRPYIPTTRLEQQRHREFLQTKEEERRKSYLGEVNKQLNLGNDRD